MKLSPVQRDVAQRGLEVDSVRFTSEDSCPPPPPRCVLRTTGDPPEMHREGVLSHRPLDSSGICGKECKKFLPGSDCRCQKKKRSTESEIEKGDVWWCDLNGTLHVKIYQIIGVKSGISNSRRQKIIQEIALSTAQSSRRLSLALSTTSPFQCDNQPLQPTRMGEGHME